MDIPHLRRSFAPTAPTGSKHCASRCAPKRKTLKLSRTQKLLRGRQMTARPRAPPRRTAQHRSAPGLRGSAVPATAALRPREEQRLAAPSLGRRGRGAAHAGPPRDLNSRRSLTCGIAPSCGSPLGAGAFPLNGHPPAKGGAGPPRRDGGTMARCPSQPPQLRPSLPPGPPRRPAAPTPYTVMCPAPRTTTGSGASRGRGSSWLRTTGSGSDDSSSSSSSSSSASSSS